MHFIALVQEVVAAFRTPEMPIHIHTSVGMVFPADPDRLHQLLKNVLANAVKYVPKQTPIVVEVHIERKTDGLWMILTVSNQRPSLPPEKLATFFQPFVSGARSTGLGLGLNLANRIAAAHGGTLSIHSSQGQRVQVTLALPIEEELIVREQEGCEPNTQTRTLFVILLSPFIDQLCCLRTGSSPVVMAPPLRLTRFMD